ncbi:MAG TPA: glycogen/starch synthase [Longimicrobiales bacterium]|nr:glycogen/starch synthase [Longimicrobiales bacterium]
MQVVHLAAEYWPFARTGGLAEAVRGIATHQAAHDTPTSVFMPLYRVARQRAPELVPACEDVVVPLGIGPQKCRILKKSEAPEGPTTYFVDHPGAFDRPGIYGEDGRDYADNHLRFALFARAVLEALPRIVPEGHIVLHPHDWHAALAPVYLREVYGGQRFYDAVACVLSVHNAGYQGLFGPEILEAIGLPQKVFHWSVMEYYGKLNWLKGGLAHADWVTTVSPTHAHELRTPAGGFGLHDSFIGMGDRLRGILNGIDQQLWNPATDPEALENYSRDDLSGKRVCKAWLQELAGLPVNPEIPLVGMTARLAKQKGFDLILGDGLLYRMDGAQFIFLGEGDRGYKQQLQEAASHLPDRVAVFFDFTEEREHRLLAGADILLMPSQYEPCGLTQMRAQRYGALPVVRRVGGLSDTVEDQETGFVFDDFTSEALEVALRRAFATYRDRDSWREHMREAMSRDFGWERSARKYLLLYEAALTVHHGL